MDNQYFSKLSTICQRLTNVGYDDNIKLYALYKQAMYGDCNLVRSEFKDSAEKSRYMTWKSLKGKTKTEAMDEYNDLVLRIINSSKSSE